MGREMVVGLLALTVSILPPHIYPAQQDPVVPFVVEQVRFVAPVREDSPPLLEITVHNTGTRLIEAWGVWGEVRYANGATKMFGISVDSYETPFLAEVLRSPAGASKLLPPQGRTTLSGAVSNIPLTTPTDAAIFPKFAIFEDDTAVGDETLIDHTFSLRRFSQRFWRLAREALASALARGLEAEQAGMATLATLEAAGVDISTSG